jgi:hypothetical protein
MTERHALGIGIRHHSGGLRSHIAELYESALCEEHGSIETNARLIAAAPTMLDALRTALQAIGDTYDARDNDEQGEMVRDIIAGAIAAATGEEAQQ